MSDPDWKDAATGVAKDVYGDGLKSPLQVVSRTTANVLEAALSPLNIVADVVNAGAARLRDRIKPRVDAIPADRLLPAPGALAPGVMQYALLGAGDDTAGIRELFENLLVSSMDSASAGNVHPAFASMIMQMSQDDAWVVKSMDRVEYAALQANYDHGVHLRVEFFTTLGMTQGFAPPRLARCLSSLERLGLIEKSSESLPDADYEALQLAAEAVGGQPGEGKGVSVGSSSISIKVTALGIDFLNACARPTEAPLFWYRYRS